MGRKQNLPDLPPVDAFDVAPHRYRYDCETMRPATWKEVKASAPYRPGDVVFVVYGDSYAKAIIHDITCDRDRWDDLREAYHVRRETAKGQWAKKTYLAHPGYIQRGYHRAGLAPEIPEGVRV